MMEPSFPSNENLFLASEVPGTGGRIKEKPEDFVVEEVPLYEPCGEGAHLYIRVEKRGISTPEAISRIAHALGVHPKKIGYAGLKDSLSISFQTFSLEGIGEKAALDLDLPGIRVLWAKHHRNKLHLGHLKGNRFSIRIKGIVPERKACLEASLEILKRRGVPNFFGKQRFGGEEKNHLMGKALLKGNRREAAAIHSEGKKCASPRRNKKGGMNPFEKRGRRFFISAYQSFLFNQLLAQRLQNIDRLFKGDLAYIHEKGAVFKVEDPISEEERVRSFEISPSGPLFGYKIPLAEDAPGRMEKEILEREGLTLESFRRGIRGERRPFRFFFSEMDSHFQGGDALVSFFLPRGCYATTLLREVMKI